MVIAGLYLGRPVLIPLALAMVLAFLLSPVVGLLEKTHIGRVTSVLTVLVLSFGLLGIVGWTVIGQLTQILEQVPDYRANIHNKIVLLRQSRDNSLTRAAATEYREFHSALGQNGRSRHELRLLEIREELRVSLAALKFRAFPSQPFYPFRITGRPLSSVGRRWDLFLGSCEP